LLTTVDIRTTRIVLSELEATATNILFKYKIRERYDLEISTLFIFPCVLRNMCSSLAGATAQAVSRRLLIVEARVRTQVSPCGTCGGHSGTRQVSQYHSTPAPYSLVYRLGGGQWAL
jgi:hypothetical protein